MESSISPQSFITGIEIWRQANNLAVASATIVVMDWLQLLSLEISLIWAARCSPLKVLFLLVRYAPFLYLPILLYHQFGSGLDPDTCQVIYAIVNWMFAAGLGSADLILTIRTWATLGSNRKAAYFFFPLIALIHVAILVLVGLWLRSTHELSFPELGIGCLLESRRPILAASYILLMALDAGNLLLMVTRGIKIFKLGNGSQLSRIVYGDGIIYYDCLFSLSLLNTFIIFLLPDYYLLPVLMEGVVHSTLACRVVLNIRDYGTTLENGTSGTPVASQPLRFMYSGTTHSV